MSDPMHSTTPPAGGGGSGSIVRFLDGVGAPARRRPPVSVAGALTAGGGALCAAGVLLLTEESSRGVIAVVGAAIVAAAYLLQLKAPSNWHLRPALVAMTVVGVPVFAFAATDVNADKPTASFALITALFIAAYIAPGFRGRPVPLGIGLLTFLGFLTALLQDSGQSCDPYYDSCGVFDDVAGGVGDFVSRQSWIFLIAAVAFVLATRWLDRRGYLGTGTPFAMASIVSAIAGGLLFWLRDPSESTRALLFAGVGIGLAVGGVVSTRRAMVWFGAAIATVGAVATVLVASTPSSAKGAGGLTLFTGAAMIGAVAIVRQARSGKSATSSAAPPPPPPVAPPPAAPPA